MSSRKRSVDDGLRLFRDAMQMIRSAKTFRVDFVDKRGNPPALPGDSWGLTYTAVTVNLLSRPRDRGYTDERIPEFESYEMGL